MRISTAESKICTEGCIKAHNMVSILTIMRSAAVADYDL